MKILLFILAAIFAVSASVAKHNYKTDYFRQIPTFSQYTYQKFHWALGSIISAASEGICWWYIVKNLIVWFS